MNRNQHGCYEDVNSIAESLREIAEILKTERKRNSYDKFLQTLFVLLEFRLFHDQRVYQDVHRIAESLREIVEMLKDEQEIKDNDRKV